MGERRVLGISDQMEIITTMEISMEVTHKTLIDLSYDLLVLLLDIFPKESVSVQWRLLNAHVYRHNS